MTIFEEFVLQKVNEGRTIVGLYPLIDAKIKEEFGANIVTLLEVS